MNANLRCETKPCDYHVSVVGVKGLFDERKLVRSQLLLTVDELGKLGKRGFSNKSSVTRVMCDGRCCQDGKCVSTHLSNLVNMQMNALTAHGLSQRL